MKNIINNREALFNYEPLEKFQAGLVLTGPEVKSVKAGRISLKAGFVTIDRHGEMWLINCHISPYNPAKGQQQKYDPTRPRKLLLNRKEIDSLIGKSRQKGLTIVPLSVYTKRGLIKAEIALARGKTKPDKREAIKKREAIREIQRGMR